MSFPDLSGKVALVTGARRGLGLAMAKGLAEAGCVVFGVAVSADCQELDEVMKSLNRPYAYSAADLSKREAREGLIQKVVDRFGRLDILVNGAGIQHRSPALDFGHEPWDKIQSLMLTAVFELSQQAARVMDKQGGGKIVNIASVASFQGGWTIPAYAAAKHGVAGLTKALANEWASRNINVNAIAPGYFATDMCQGILKDPEREPRIRERIPAGRWGRPEDLVGPLLFLCGDASTYVHGHVLVVDGGWMGR